MSLDSLKTVSESRPDLAAIKVNPPTSYVGNKVFPVLPVAAKVGDIPYASLVADSAAQTNRTPGTAPDATVLGESSKAFSATEIVKRYIVPYGTVPLYGGVEGSDKVGAAASKRSVSNAIEKLQLAALIDADGTDISSGIIDGLGNAAESVKRYSGKTALVASSDVYRWMIKQSEITGLLGRSFGGLTAEQVLSVQPKAMLAILAGVFGFDRVLIADSSLYPAAYTYTAAVVKLPEGDAYSFAMQPEYGRTALYLPVDAETPYEVNSFSDDDARGNVYDATAWTNVLQFNSGAKSLVKLGSIVTTTTVI